MLGGDEKRRYRRRRLLLRLPHTLHKMVSEGLISKALIKPVSSYVVEVSVKNRDIALMRLGFAVNLGHEQVSNTFIPPGLVNYDIVHVDIPSAPESATKPEPRDADDFCVRECGDASVPELQHFGQTLAKLLGWHGRIP
jgi:hypothetical protein